MAVVEVHTSVRDLWAMGDVLYLKRGQLEWSVSGDWTLTKRGNPDGLRLIATHDFVITPDPRERITRRLLVIKDRAVLSRREGETYASVYLSRAHVEPAVST